MKLPLAILAGAALCACAGNAHNPGMTRSSSLTVDGHTTTELSFVYEDQQLHATYSGAIELTADDSAVASLDEDGQLIVEQVSGRARRRVEFSTSKDGGVLVDDYIDGRRVVPDVRGLAWRATVLLELVKRFDLGREARGARLLEEGGARALLDHLEFTTQGRFAAYYLPLVLQDDSLRDADLPDLALRASRVTSSSSVLASFLIELSARAPQDAALTDALIEAEGALSSNSARSEVLTQVLSLRTLDDAQVLDVIYAAGELSSASGCAFVLAAVADREGPIDPWRERWLGEVRDLPSTSRQTELYLQLLAREDCSAQTSASVALSARSLTSTAGQSEVVSALIAGGVQDHELFDAILALIEGSSSSSRRAESLTTLLDVPNLDRDQLRAMNTVAKQIASQSARARVQERIIERLLLLD